MWSLEGEKSQLSHSSAVRLADLHSVTTGRLVQPKFQHEPSCLLARPIAAAAGSPLLRIARSRLPAKRLYKYVQDETSGPGGVACWET